MTEAQIQSDDMGVYDVIVVGAGAGGLSAAITARSLGLSVAIVEKEPVYGGTTARSGGWLWIPCNSLAKEEGIKDTREAAYTYLRHEAGNYFDESRVNAFLDNGPKMVDFFHKETAVKFYLGPTFADYHAEAPGGVVGGRSICAQPFDGRELGGRIKTLRPPLPEITLLGMMLGSNKEIRHFLNATRSIKSIFIVAGLLLKYARDLAFHGRGMRLTNGNALAGRLAKAVFDLNIPIWLSSPVKELQEDGQRTVTGVVVEREGKRVSLTARRGVVLAAGGFPHDMARRAKLYPHLLNGSEHWSPTSPASTGDGIRLGEAAGGEINSAVGSPAAWAVVSKVPHRDGTTGLFPHFIDRQKPGIIAVTRKGLRFVNEGNSYFDFISAMIHVCQDTADCSAFLICDHAALRRYGMGFVKPYPLPYSHHVRSGYLLKGKTLDDLATAAGIDVANFKKTVVDYNVHARAGQDPQFGKGTTAYNRYLGDPDHKPNPCVAPVEQGPFYAIRVFPGDLGTFIGLKTDRYSRVLNSDGEPVLGLYAVGNDNASVFGGNYVGGGTTLGPAMTFGYIAARHLAEARA
ncbi:FAD-dependent oxidoreductase [Methylocapsa sp. S129]|uniref:FAD-dependent oxidoreductase n=1 Tax=Methylocapsa sp. S129 TaxID=1641869 RepID=UPI00131BB314|nr:FAD-dependent oxidoreductase [Methylocapsa sp. S129]